MTAQQIGFDLPPARATPPVPTTIAHKETGMFLGWYDPNLKLSAQTKVADAVARYREKFGSEPTICLTSNGDAKELGPEVYGMPVRAASYIGRYTYYVGVEEAHGIDLAS